jgi:hypothetical protein
MKVETQEEGNKWMKKMNKVLNDCIDTRVNHKDIIVQGFERINACLSGRQFEEEA